MNEQDERIGDAGCGDALLWVVLLLLLVIGLLVQAGNVLCRGAACG